MGNASPSIVQKACVALVTVIGITLTQAAVSELVDISTDPFVMAVKQERTKPNGLGDSSSIGQLMHTPINSKEDAEHIMARLSATHGDEREMRLILAGVSSRIPEIRQTAIHQLLDPHVREQVQSYSEYLIPELANYAENENSANLLGLLNLSEPLKSDVLASPTVPDRVVARLGDVEAEARAINRFHSAQPFNRMVYAEQDLLYIDSRQSLTALVDELNSLDVHVDRFGNQISVTQMLIQAYGRVHPDVTLFQPEAYLPHCYTSENEFQAPEHQAYMRSVEDYFSGILERPVDIEVPFLILGSDRIEKYLVPPENVPD